MWKKLLCALTAFVLLFALAACGKEAEPEPEAAAPEETTAEIYNAYYFSGDDLASLEALRAATVEAGKTFAFAYLGHTDGFVNMNGEFDQESQDALHTLLRDSGYDERYPFLMEIPTYRIATTGGTELYCIVPAEGSEGIALYNAVPGAVSADVPAEDPSDVSVPEAGEDGAGVIGEEPFAAADTASRGEQFAYTLFDSPLLLCADSLDGSLGAFVEISGEHAAGFLTAYGGAIPADAYDFTIYPEELRYEWLGGSWEAHGISDDNASVRTLRFEFPSENEFAYSVISEDEGFFNGKTILHFSGSWEIASGSDVTLSVTADGGNYIDGGVPAYDVNCLCSLHLNEDGTLSVRALSGDPFFQGISTNVLLFEKQ